MSKTTSADLNVRGDYSVSQLDRSQVGARRERFGRKVVHVLSLKQVGWFFGGVFWGWSVDYGS